MENGNGGRDSAVVADGLLGGAGRFEIGGPRQAVGDQRGLQRDDGAVGAERAGDFGTDIEHVVIVVGSRDAER